MPIEVASELRTKLRREESWSFMALFVGNSGRKKGAGGGVNPIFHFFQKNISTIMNWTRIFPLLDEEMVDRCQSEMTEGERREFEEWFGGKTQDARAKGRCGSAVLSHSDLPSSVSGGALGEGSAWACI